MTKTHTRSERWPEHLLENIPDPDGFTGEFNQTFKEESISVLHNIYQEIEAKGTLFNSFYETGISLLPKQVQILKERKTID